MLHFVREGTVLVLPASLKHMPWLPVLGLNPPTYCLMTFKARLLNMLNYSQLPYYYG